MDDATHAPRGWIRLVEETARLTRIFRSVTVVSDNVPLAISKEIIRQMSKGFADLDFAAHKLLADTILRKTQPRIASSRMRFACSCFFSQEIGRRGG